MKNLKAFFAAFTIIFSNASFSAVVPWIISGHVQNNTGVKATDLHFTLNIGDASGFGGYVDSIRPFYFSDVESVFKSNSIFYFNNAKTAEIELTNPPTKIGLGEFADFEIPFVALESAQFSISNVYWTGGGITGGVPGNNTGGGTIIEEGQQPNAKSINVMTVSSTVPDPITIPEPATIFLVAIGASGLFLSKKKSIFPES